MIDKYSKFSYYLNCNDIHQRFSAILGPLKSVVEFR
jgi:hypothetical protein